MAGIVIGIVTFRLRGHYFALSMLAYPLAMLYVFEWLGYQEVTLPMMRDAPALYAQFSDPRAYMVIALALVVACMLVSLHVERSRFGMSLLAIKQNEPAAEAAGIDALAWKMRAMVLSAAMAAAAGGLYAVVLLVVMPNWLPSSLDQTYDACICHLFDMRFTTDISSALYRDTQSTETLLPQLVWKKVSLPRYSGLTS